MNRKQAQHDHAALPRIRELKAEGRSLREIADQLQKEGVPPPPRGRQWHHKAVDRILARAATRPEEVPPPVSSAPTPPPSPHSPAQLKVQIHGPWIRTDGLLWEFLLHQVWDDLDQKPDHTLPIKEGVKGLRRAERRRDREHLCDALARLSRSGVVLDGADGPRLLTVTTPLISAACTEDILHFQFPTALLTLVKNPQQYVQLQELLAAKS